MAAPAWVARYVGIPFAVHGRDHAGCDCYGLVRLALAEQAGIELPAFEGEGWRPDSSPEEKRALVEDMARYRREQRAWVSMPLGSERTFDALFLRMRGMPMHVGLVVAPGLMLHVERGCDAVCENYRLLHWRRRIVEVCRHVSLA